MSGKGVAFVFDFGGVLAASAFSCLYSLSDVAVEKALATAAAGSVDPATNLLQTDSPHYATVAPLFAPCNVDGSSGGRCRRMMVHFMTVVNKVTQARRGDAKAPWLQLETGRISRDDYVQQFPTMAREAVDAFLLPRGVRELKRAGVGEHVAHIWLDGVMKAFLAHFDINALLQAMERSPLRRNVFQLLLGVRRFCEEERRTVRCGIITNNWRTMEVLDCIDAAATAAATGAAMAPQCPLPPGSPAPPTIFDTIVESYKVHARKPHAEVFEMCCEKLHATLPKDVAGLHVVFFDDLHSNVDGARACGVVNTAVRVKSSVDIFAGVLAGLRSVGFDTVAARVEHEFARVFSAAYLATDVLQTEARQNCIFLPTPRVAALLPPEEIPAAQRFDGATLARLLRYLGDKLPFHFPVNTAGAPDAMPTFLPCVEEGGPLVIEYFKGGMSNPTFRLTLRTGSYVLRKQPKGKLLPGAHDVGREFRVMSYLASKANGVPTLQCLHLCEDPSVLGTQFYVTAFQPGDIVRTGEQLMALRRPKEFMGNAVDVLAKLHALPVPKFMARKPPASAAPPRHHLLRVVETWAAQYRRGNERLVAAIKAAQAKPSKYASATEGFHVPPFLELTDTLNALLADASAVPVQAPTICHGDYKFDNMIVTPEAQLTNEAEGCKIVALLDFELCHVSDPLSDLAYMCLAHFMPPPRGVLGLDRVEERLMSVDEVLERYVALTGRLAKEQPSKEGRRAILNVYIAQACHKLAGIIHGVVVRAMIGNASDVSGGLKLRRNVAGLSEMGLMLLQEGPKSAALSKL